MMDPTTMLSPSATTSTAGVRGVAGGDFEATLTAALDLDTTLTTPTDATGRPSWTQPSAESDDHAGGRSLDALLAVLGVDTTAAEVVKITTSPAEGAGSDSADVLDDGALPDERHADDASVADAPVASGPSGETSVGGAMDDAGVGDSMAADVGAVVSDAVDPVTDGSDDASSADPARSLDATARGLTPSGDRGGLDSSQGPGDARRGDVTPMTGRAATGGAQQGDSITPPTGARPTPPRNDDVRGDAVVETTDRVRPSGSGVAATDSAPQPVGQHPPVATADRATPRAVDLPSSIQRVLDAVELLENAPPPRHLTLELGEVRIRVAVEDGQVRLSLLGDASPEGSELLEDAFAALAERGFDLEGDDHADEAPNDDGQDPVAPATRRETRPTAGLRL